MLFVRLMPSTSRDIERTPAALNSGSWVHLLEDLQKHDVRVVLELLSAFVDQHGGVSLPSLFGCIRALVEASLNTLGKRETWPLLWPSWRCGSNRREGEA